VKKGYIIYGPAAFLRAVKFVAFTTAFTPPVTSSNTRVVAGSPRGSDLAGTQTTLTAVPPKVNPDDGRSGSSFEALVDICAGINTAVWWRVGMTMRGGMDIRSRPSLEEIKVNTLAIRSCRSCGEKVEVIASTSLDERTSNDIVVWNEPVAFGPLSSPYQNNNRKKKPKK
jgi:hypothetical protein